MKNTAQPIIITHLISGSFYVKNKCPKKDTPQRTTHRQKAYFDRGTKNGGFRLLHALHLPLFAHSNRKFYIMSNSSIHVLKSHIN